MRSNDDPISSGSMRLCSNSFLFFRFHSSAFVAFRMLSIRAGVSVGGDWLFWLACFHEVKLDE